MSGRTDTAAKKLRNWPSLDKTTAGYLDTPSAAKPRCEYCGPLSWTNVIGLVLASVGFLAMVGIFIGFFGVLTYEFWRAVL